MKKQILQAAAAVLMTCGISACSSSVGTISYTHQADQLSVVRLTDPARYLLLPIQETSQEARVKLFTNRPTDIYMDIRLAIDSVDYYVPFEIPEGAEAVIHIAGLDTNAVAWKEMKLSETFDTTNRDYYRALYHHTPKYGWMNDANGLVYKDGEYHLYYQYNPYGSKWGNMHWGHSVSKDLIQWEHLAPAIARDTLGHIFSGSTVVDKDNTAGFGKNAIVAFYTSHRWNEAGEQEQEQSMAYSLDNGRTYIKYEGNPILRPFDGIKDFRDPKVFWYEPAKAWYMIVSADKEMRFYSSKNLKEWTYLSAFGRGYGVQPNQFECPDFFQLPVNGDPNRKKWVMIVNINPGCPFGGSATEYFVGEFDGKVFKPDTKPEVTKWLDFGKDHYATVTFSNTGDRIIGVPWTSNWQYANITPFQQHRGANGLPRDLALYTCGNDIYMSANVVKEAEVLRKETRKEENIVVNGDYKMDNLLKHNEGAMEIGLTLTPDSLTKRFGFELTNSKGEVVPLYFDLQTAKFVMDRTKSGIVDFGQYAVPHDIENHDRRKTESINYINDFALATWAPLQLLEGRTYRLQVFVDKSSVEIFIDGGRIAMTNLVFPTEPYNALRFFSEGGQTQVTDFSIHKLSL